MTERSDSMFKYTVAGSQCKNFDTALKLIAQNLSESDSVNCRIEFDDGETYTLNVQKESNQVFFDRRWSLFVFDMMLKQTFNHLPKPKSKPKSEPKSKSKYESIPRLSKDSVIVAFESWSDVNSPKN